LDLADIPENALTFAVNEGIAKLGERADFWVLSDNQIVFEYASKCPFTTEILCMHEATAIIKKHCKMNVVHTVDSMNRIKDYDNGFQFYSRGTVMIGAIEMARFMGVQKFYIFGLDCYRKRDQYYFDNRRPVTRSENNFDDRNRVITKVPAGSRIYVTPRLKRMQKKLEEVEASGLWNGTELYCVNSPLSQQTVIPKMTMEDFKKETATKPLPTPAPPKKKQPPALKITDAMWEDVCTAFIAGYESIKESGGKNEKFDSILSRVELGKRSQLLYYELLKAIEVINDAQWSKED
jgi:hypothetical protein